MEDNLYELAEQLRQELPYLRPEGQELIEEATKNFRRITQRSLAQRTLEFCDQNVMYKTYITGGLSKLYMHTQSEDIYQLMLERFEDLEKNKTYVEYLKLRKDAIPKSDWLTMFKHQVEIQPDLVEVFLQILDLLLPYEEND